MDRSALHLIAEASKDGYLYAFDVQSGARVFANPVTRIENRDVPFDEHPVHFCPERRAVQSGTVPPMIRRPISSIRERWIGVRHLASSRRRIPRACRRGSPWSANQAASEKEAFGKLDAAATWAGWIYATDADSGATAWKFKARFSVMSGVMPTAGGVVFAGDMGCTLYAFDAEGGEVLWLR